MSGRYAVYLVCHCPIEEYTAEPLNVIGQIQQTLHEWRPLSPPSDITALSPTLFSPPHIQARALKGDMLRLSVDKFTVTNCRVSFQHSFAPLHWAWLPAAAAVVHHSGTRPKLCVRSCVSSGHEAVEKGSCSLPPTHTHKHGCYLAEQDL